MSRKARWLAEWRKFAGKPVLYHVHSRVVDRRFVLGTEEKEKFRTLMRMQENFTGCRALSYCLMDNHFHILLEVPPMADGGRWAVGGRRRAMERSGPEVGNLIGGSE